MAMTRVGATLALAALFSLHAFHPADARISAPAELAQASFPAALQQQKNNAAAASPIRIDRSRLYGRGYLILKTGESRRA